LVKKEIQNAPAIMSGAKRRRVTRTYHQWMYSLRKRKKFHMKRITIRRRVKTPMEITPALIGRHPQHEDS